MFNGTTAAAHPAATDGSGKLSPGAGAAAGDHASGVTPVRLAPSADYQPRSLAAVSLAAPAPRRCGRESRDGPPLYYPLTVCLCACLAPFVPRCQQDWAGSGGEQSVGSHLVDHSVESEILDLWRQVLT